MADPAKAVIDVVAPPAMVAAGVNIPQPQSSAGPAAAPKAPPAGLPRPAAKPEQSAKPASQQPSPTKPKSGVGLAIFATVIIVLGLAGLATYAYLKQTGSL